MPLPFIIGAIALGTAAYGAKKGYDGYQKHSEADDIVNSAKSRYDREKSHFDKKEKETTTALDELGKFELLIGQRIGEFKKLADDLLAKLNSSRDLKLEVKIPKHKIDKIENYTYTAIGVLGTMAGAGATGAAAGFAVYGGVMALGAASTGTAISSLAGAAATNATLAAIGGGSLATGGLGIAGGTAILGAAIAAPVIAIAGWAYNSHGEEALRNARKVDREVDAAIEKLSRAKTQLDKTISYAGKIHKTISTLYTEFNEYFDHLKQMDIFIQQISGRNIDVNAELAKISDDVMQVVDNGFALASILVDVITTPLFKTKTENGTFVKDHNGLPVMETDNDGSMILNSDAIDQAIDKVNH